MPVKQVKLNLKPEIYKPLAQEAKRLRMPIAALVRAILADSILPSQDELETTTINDLLELPTEMTSEVVTEYQRKDETAYKSQTGTRTTRETTELNNELLINAAKSLADSAYSLAETTNILAASVSELAQMSNPAVRRPAVAQPAVAQPAVTQTAASQPAVSQPQVDRDGELVLKLSDLLTQQGIQVGDAENTNVNGMLSSTVGNTPRVTMGLAERGLEGVEGSGNQDVIVEDLNSDYQPAKSNQPIPSTQKLRKITINL